MFRWVDLLLLFSLVKYSGTSAVGNSLIHVTGNRGDNATLPCDFKAREVLHIILSQSKIIPVCENEKCKSDRAFKTGLCDVILMDLRLRDAGRYILRIYYYNNQTEPERQIRTYQLHIHGEISGNTGQELKLDVLVVNADKVETDSSGEWTEVWTRGHGVSSDRLTDSDGTLSINAFTSTDTGTYRVLDSEGQILITVSLSDSKGEIDTGDDRPDDTEQHPVWKWILIVGMAVYAVSLALALLFFVIKKQQFQKRKGDSYQGIAMQPT